MTCVKDNAILCSTCIMHLLMNLARTLVEKISSEFLLNVVFLLFSFSLEKKSNFRVDIYVHNHNPQIIDTTWDINYLKIYSNNCKTMNY